MKSILDRSFRYTPSSLTDVGRTFARLREEQRRTDFARSHASGAIVSLLQAKQPRAGESNKG